MVLGKRPLSFSQLDWGTRTGGPGHRAAAQIKEKTGSKNNP
jgi:hypothetical protein